MTFDKFFFSFFQEKVVLERRAAELEEELKVRATRILSSPSFPLQSLYLLAPALSVCLCLKVLGDLKADNQRLKDENGALIRVISKLSK